MNRLDELMQKYCAGGIIYKSLWQVTVWDKKFNSVSKEKQQQTITYPYLLANELFDLEKDGGDVFLLSTGERIGWTDEERAGNHLCYGEVVTIPWGKSRPVVDCIKYYKGKFVTADNRIATSFDTSVLLNKFLYYWLMNQGPEIDKLYRGSGIKHPDMSQVLELKIPVPPLPVQEEIVRILDKFTELEAELAQELAQELAHRKQQYAFYRDQLLNFDNIIPMKLIGDICIVHTGGEAPIDCVNQKDEQHPYAVYGNGKEVYGYSAKYKIDKDSVVISSIGANTGAIYYREAFFTPIVRLKVVIPKSDDLDSRYLFHALSTKKIKSKNSTVPNMNADEIKQLKIPVPSIDVQKRLAYVLDNFDAICSDLSIGLPAEIAAREKQYNYYRDLLFNYAADMAGFKQSRAEQSRAEQSRAEQSRAEQKLIAYVFGPRKCA